MLIIRIENAYKRPTYQRKEGFDLSPTAANLNLYFQDVFSSKNEIRLIVIEEEFDWAMTSLLKGSIIEADQFSEFRFTSIRRDGHTLEFQDADVHKQIQYEKLYGNSSVDSFLERLARVITDSDTSPLFLIVAETWLINNGIEPTDSSWPGLVTSISRTQIEPYWVYELGTK